MLREERRQLAIYPGRTIGKVPHYYHTVPHFVAFLMTPLQSIADIILAHTRIPGLVERAKAIPVFLIFYKRENAVVLVRNGVFLCWYCTSLRTQLKPYSVNCVNALGCIQRLTALHATENGGGKSVLWNLGIVPTCSKLTNPMSARKPASVGLAVTDYLGATFNHSVCQNKSLAFQNNFGLPTLFHHKANSFTAGFQH